VTSDAGQARYLHGYVKARLIERSGYLFSRISPYKSDVSCVYSNKLCILDLSTEIRDRNSDIGSELVGEALWENDGWSK
jgi:hypothetical protein